MNCFPNYRTKCPCTKDCCNRTTTCKSTCAKYKLYEHKHMEERAELIEAKKHRFKASEFVNPYTR